MQYKRNVLKDYSVGLEKMFEGLGIDYFRAGVISMEFASLIL